MMKPTTRRQFLKCAGTTAVLSLPLSSQRTLASGTNERLRIGVIGGGNQGSNHIRSLKSVPAAEIAYVCDIDQQRLAKCVATAEGAKGVTDLRSILDDASVDAVTIATPDHWHVPAALLALDAGKHVYVEKPCSHNVHEGRLLVDFARRQNRVVVHGTQARSCRGIQEAMEQLRAGVIGDILSAKCWNWQRRESIGKQQPTPPPDHVDYDTWVGPAEWLPYQANRFHYQWHWWYNFGTGDMGNDGAHEIDYALWGLGVDTHPHTIAALGGKYFFDDDQQYPDTQEVTFAFTHPDGGPSKMLVFEMRLWSTNYPFNVDGGVEFHGTEGRLLLSKRGKYEFLGARNRPLDVSLQHSTKSSVVEHLQHWVAAVQTGIAPNAPIEVGHRTATAIHLGNIATRLQRTLRFDGETETVIDDPAANAMLSRTYRNGGHWSVPKE